jgi:TRAP-type C4-dicarboxylate transport system substrate-binding protein
VKLRPRPRSILLIALLMLAASAPAEAQRAMIKMATLVPQGSNWHTILQEMAAKWQDASGGRITVRLYPGGVAGDDTDVVRKMRLGTLDAGVLTVSGFADIDRSIFALCVPMMYDSYQELDAVTAKLTPELEKRYEDKGFVVLALADAGWVHFFATSPVRTPDDLKKLKMFSWAGDDRGIELWKAAGFKPVPLPSTEISTALQTGLVDVVPTTSRAAVLLQWYRNAPYMTDLRWAPLLGGVVLSRAAWEKVPEDLRPAFTAAAREAVAKLSASTRAGETDDIAAMKAHGLTVVEVDAAALAEWRSAAEAVYPTLRDSFVPGEIFDQAMRLRDAFRSTK